MPKCFKIINSQFEGSSIFIVGEYAMYANSLRQATKIASEYKEPKVTFTINPTP